MEIAHGVGMTTTPLSPLEEVTPSSLEAVSGGNENMLGFKWDEKSPRSDNVIDCRGDTCLDSNGKVDPVATALHKRKRPKKPVVKPK